jgi:hypothetical protein
MWRFCKADVVHDVALYTPRRNFARVEVRWICSVNFDLTCDYQIIRDIQIDLPPCEPST